MVVREGPDPVDIAVGERVRIRRRELKISQTTLAGALGITFQQVQKYERGKNRISASMLVKTAATLETTVGALVGEDDSEPVEPIVYGRLAVTGAPELLAAYAEIKGAEVRSALIRLAQALCPAAHSEPIKRSA